MKYQSKLNKNIFFEEMQDTPISFLRGLTLVSMFLWAADVYFFFSRMEKK